MTSNAKQFLETSIEHLARISPSLSREELEQGATDVILETLRIQSVDRELNEILNNPPTQQPIESSLPAPPSK